jgi:major membrane immunogen (membrane-anchored lipoprotein)|tara:strand:+ start:69 stop:269 length:201 start_codon:yes stop_codon:yes gene_type:complete
MTIKDGKYKYEVYLIDDGSLDTVIEINGKNYRFDSEYVSIYRDKNGVMTEKGLKELAEETIYLEEF